MNYQDESGNALRAAWGIANYRALLTTSRWISRKREKLEFVSARSVTRRLDIEFQVPDALRLEGYDLSRALAVIASVPKGTTGAVEVVDSRGARLPTLNAAEAAALVDDMLIAAAQQLLGNGESRERAYAMIEILRARMEGLGLGDASDEHPDSEMSSKLRLLMEDSLFSSLLRQSRTHDAIVLELEAERRERRIVTIVYEMAVRRAPHSPRDKPWHDRLARLGQSIGWIETQVGIAFSSLEVPCPYELDIVTADGIDLTRASVGTKRSEKVVWPDADTPRGGRFLRVSLTPGDNWPAILTIRMRPQRSYPLAVLLTAMFSAVVLTFSWWHLHTLAETTDAAAAILLAAPALFTTWVAQPGRASPAAGLLTVARGVLGLCGVLTYAAAAAIVMIPRHLPPISNLPRHFWLADIAVSWVLVAVLLAPLFVPVFQSRWRWRLALPARARQRQGGGETDAQLAEG
jgi:hypothetical protein